MGTKKDSQEVQQLKARIAELEEKLALHSKTFECSLGISFDVEALDDEEADNRAEFVQDEVIQFLSNNHLKLEIQSIDVFDRTVTER